MAIGVVPQEAQHAAQLLPPLPRLHRVVETVHGLEEFPVLEVHGLEPDAQLRGPCGKGHAFLS